MRRRWLSFLAFIAFGLACQSASAPAAPEGTLLGTWAGQHGVGLNAVGTRILRTEDDWQSFIGMAEAAPPRAFNPRRETVIVVMLGERRTGGYGVEVLSTRIEKKQLVLECRETKPAPGAEVTQEITTPWVAAFVARTSLPVVVRYQNAETPKR